MKLVPICAYQGGKGRLAQEIVTRLRSYGLDQYADVGCGSGAISIELVTQGISPDKITMVDAGPWGTVWQEIGSGSFDMELWDKLVAECPEDRREIQAWVTTLSKRSAEIATSQTFLLLQAAAFGSKAIWTQDSQWKNTTFRSYWEPTATSSRRSPVNPMMPMPDTLSRRLIAIREGMKGVTGICGKAEDLGFEDMLVYIDPPYGGLTGYGHNMKVMQVIDAAKNCVVVVSEARALEGADEIVELSSGRAKGGISGERTKANPEILSIFRR